MVLSIGLIVADHRHGHLDTLRSTLSVVVYPLHYLASLPDALGRLVTGRLAKEENCVSQTAPCGMRTCC